LKYGKLTSLEKQIEAGKRATTLPERRIDEQDIAHVVSRWTGNSSFEMLGVKSEVDASARGIAQTRRRSG